MTTQDRDRIRELQDKLIALAEESGVNLDLQLSVEYPGSPTIRQLRHMLYPDWESAIRYAVNYLESKK